MSSPADHMRAIMAPLDALVSAMLVRGQAPLADGGRTAAVDRCVIAGPAPISSTDSQSGRHEPGAGRTPAAALLGVAAATRPRPARHLRVVGPDWPVEDPDGGDR